MEDERKNELQATSPPEEYELWARVQTWAKALRIKASTIRLRIQGITGIDGITKNGRIIKGGYISESVIQEKCADLLLNLPVANENGFFIENNETYGTIAAWTHFFKGKISKLTLSKNLKNESVIAGRNSSGKMITQNFYSEIDVRKKCASLLNSPQSNEEGFIFVNGEKYATIKRWGSEFNISTEPMKRRLSPVKGMIGRGASGQVGKFYSEIVVRTLVSDLLQDLPQADGNGFFVIDSNRYGTASAWGKAGLAEDRIRKLVRNGHLKGITGKDGIGRVWSNGFFRESEIHEKLKNYENLRHKNVKGITILGKDGEAVRNARIIIGLHTYCEKTGKTFTNILIRAQQAGIKKLEGIVNQYGREVIAFWKEEIVALGDSQLELNSQGQVIIGGRVAVGLHMYCKYKNTDSSKIANKLQIGQIRPISSIKASHSVDLYWKDEVDSYIPLELNEQGELEINGSIAVGLAMYADTVGLRPETLRKYCFEADLHPIPNVVALGRKKPAILYWKKEVDALIPYRPDENGEVHLNGQIAMGISGYSTRQSINFDTMVNNVLKAGLKPIPNVRGLEAKSKYINLYWKKELDASIPHKLDDNGVTSIDGVEVVGLAGYGASHGINNTHIERWVKNAGLQPLSNLRVKGGVRDVRVYIKEQVDAILQSKGRI